MTRVRSHPAAARWERISPVDASNLRVERHGLPMTVAALAVVEAAPLLDPDGRLSLDTLRRHVEARTARVPRLRRVLLETPWWQGPPAWVDAPEFDIRDHVRVRTLPHPGDEAALLRSCCELNAPALDLSRPPWELWVLTGRTDGTLALLLRLHHVAADGAAALALFGAFFDEAPAPPDRGPATGPAPADAGWTRRTPTSADLVRDDLLRRAAACRAAPARLAGHARPSALARTAATGVGLVRLLGREGRAPELSFNRPVTTARRLTLLRADLADAKTAAHRRDATVNDLLLAALAEGTRRLLAARGELRPGLVLCVSVPTSLRHTGEEVSAGNRVAVRLMRVRLDEADPERRLVELARSTRAVKRLPPVQPSGRLLQRWMVHAMSHQRLINLLLSNLPGPANPLWFAGARVRDLFQIGVVQGNVPLSVGVLSYAGTLGVEIVSDATLLPDVDLFAAGMADALDVLIHPPAASRHMVKTSGPPSGSVKDPRTTNPNRS